MAALLSVARVEEMFGVLLRSLDAVLTDLPDGRVYASRFVLAMEAEVRGEFEERDASDILEALRTAVRQTRLLRLV